MVNADRVKRKLPSLLVDGPSACSSTAKKSKKKNWNSLMYYRYRLGIFKANNPEKFNTLTNKLIADLTEFEKAINS